NRPSHRLVDSLEALFACLHPEHAPTALDERDRVTRGDVTARPSVRPDGG
ncbi:cobalamin-binding protein, partial [Halorubrum sp. SS5]